VLPDLPTFEEQGVPGVLADNWFGLVAPAKTPAAIIAKLNKAVNNAVTSADVKSKLEAQGAIMGGGTAEDSAGTWSTSAQNGPRSSSRPGSNNNRISRTGDERGHISRARSLLPIFP